MGLTLKVLNTPDGHVPEERGGSLAAFPSWSRVCPIYTQRLQSAKFAHSAFERTCRVSRVLGIQGRTLATRRGLYEILASGPLAWGGLQASVCALLYFMWSDLD